MADSSIYPNRRYDGLDRLTGETTPQGSVSYTYDADGRRLTAQPSGGTQISYSYDTASRLTGITQGTAQVGFTYDNANRRSTLTLPNSVTVQYGYDVDSRIASIAYSYNGNSLGNLAYAYDQAGRRTAVTGSLAQTNLPTAYGQGTYDAANELTSWNGSAFAYDADGNMTTGLYSQQYTWDARNQLASLSGSSAASFNYDAFGRRIGETISGTTTSFQYDGVNRIAEISGSSTATILTGGVDEFFQRTDGNGTTVPLADALGSTIAMTDSSGTLATTYTYDPYGGTMSAGAGSYNTSQYTGRENDGTGLYYYRARYYNPAIGRFISPDPTGFAGGINFYAYVGDNPVSFIDPFGLKPHNPPNPPSVPPNPPSNPPPPPPHKSPHPCMTPQAAQRASLNGISNDLLAINEEAGGPDENGNEEIPQGPITPMDLGNPVDDIGLYNLAKSSWGMFKAQNNMWQNIDNQFENALWNCTPQ